MNTPELIRRKRQGEPLSRPEIEFLVRGYLSADIPEYQISAFLMAVFFKGMTPEEAAGLTTVMIESGDRFDLSGIPGMKVDKHSTGGVGDKISLPLAPLVAAGGVVVPMVSGRGLGHTGGTLDKLDAIPGYKWALDGDTFKAQLAKVGCAIIGQTDRFVPADKRLYALRDVTATVESIPLICASILSKKVAAGTDALVMDVKCGSGAFMATPEDARALAAQLISIGRALGKPVVAMLTQMNQPLGEMVGNSLEIIETLDILQGGGPQDARELTLHEAAEMFVLGKKASTKDEGYALAKKLLDQGKAMAKFVEWIAAQGGDVRIVDKRALLPQVQDIVPFRSERAGVIQSMDTRLIGVAANTLGAGRMKAADSVDPAVGFKVLRKVGEQVGNNEELLLIYHRGGKGLAEATALLERAIVVADGKTAPLPLILARLDG